MEVYKRPLLIRTTTCSSSRNFDYNNNLPSNYKFTNEDINCLSKFTGSQNSQLSDATLMSAYPLVDLLKYIHAYNSQTIINKVISLWYNYER